MTTGDVPEKEYIVRLGQVEIKRAGEDITLVTYAYMTLKCLAAAEALAQEGIRVEVVDLRTLTPLDKSTILESVEKTGKVIVVHEAIKCGVVDGDIAAMIMEEAYDDLDAPVMRRPVRTRRFPTTWNWRKPAHQR